MGIDELIKQAFDESTPGTYDKRVILSEIEEREMDITDRKTPMQKVFFVRRVCMACLIAAAVLLFSGGTYTAVNKIMDMQKRNNKYKAYKEKLIGALRMEDEELTHLTAPDNRLADALEKDRSKYYCEELSGVKVVNLGQLYGEGLSDSIFDKKKDSRLVAFVLKPDADVDMAAYRFNLYATINIDGVDYNDKRYPLGTACDFMYNNEWYVVYDISGYDIYADRDISIKFEDKNIGESVSFPVEIKSRLADKGLAEKNDKNLTAYKTFFETKAGLEDVWTDYVWDWRKNDTPIRTERWPHYNRDIFNSESDRVCGKEEIEKVSVSYDINNFPEILEHVIWGNALGNDLSEKRAYYPFYKFKIIDDNKFADIKSVDITVKGASLCKSRWGSYEEDKKASKEDEMYIGSYIDTNVNVSNEDSLIEFNTAPGYRMLFDCGETLTLSAEEINNLEDYGFMIKNPEFDYASCDDFAEAFLEKMYWQRKCLDGVRITFRIHMTDDKEYVRKIIFKHEYLGESIEIYSYLASYKVGEFFYGGI